MNNPEKKAGKRNPYPRLLHCDQCGRCMGFFITKSASFFSCTPKKAGEEPCKSHYIPLNKVTQALAEGLISVLAKCTAQTIFTENTLAIALKIRNYKTNIIDLEKTFFKLLEEEIVDNHRDMESILEKCSFYQQLLEEEEACLIAFSLKSYYAGKFIRMAQPFLKKAPFELDSTVLSTLVEKVLVTQSGQIKIYYKYIGLI